MVVTNTVMRSELEGETRFDPQYYTPENMLLEQELEAFDTFALGTVAAITDGQHGYFLLDEQSEIRQITAKCIKDGLVDRGNADRLSGVTHRKNMRSSLAANDVLVTTAGTIGEIGLVTADVPPANIDQDIGRITVMGKCLSPHFLWAYLQSKFGQFQIGRYTTGQIQGHLSLREMKRLRIPVLANCAEVEELAKQFVRTRTKCNEGYASAHFLLESELGLDKLEFERPVGYTASTVSLEAVVSAGRVDAQCFAPEALVYERWLSERNKCERLADMLEPTAKGRQQEEDDKGKIPYCSIKDIKHGEIVNTVTCRCPKGTPLAAQGDLLVAVTGATIGKAGMVTRHAAVAFCGDLVRLRSNGRANPYYLLVALTHRIGQAQLCRWTTGSTNGHLAPRDVGRVFVPRLKPKVETKIAELVASSFSQRREAELLLEKAKARVEQLIEEATR